MTPPPLTARDIVFAMEHTAVTHVAGIPDNTSAPIFAALTGHHSIRLVTVTREGEAFSLASGVWLGGGSPMVVVQNTGLLESGDALRGTAVRMGVPLPILVTGRGYVKMERAGLSPDVARDPGLLQRPEVDSAALMTEPTLDAWGIPWRRAASAADAALLNETIARARSEERPVALILTRPLGARGVAE